MNKNIQQIEEWTKKKYSEIVFDSDIHNWSQNDSQFDSLIIGKNHLAFIIEDERGEIFGYYINSSITYQYDERVKVDQNSFAFNLHSNGRLPNPMKFNIIDTYGGGYFLFDKSHEFLINIGSLFIHKQNQKDQSYHENQNDEFNYNYLNIPYALCGKIPGPFSSLLQMFTPKRILVIHFI